MKNLNFKIAVTGRDRMYDFINVSCNTETRDIEAVAVIIKGKYTGISFTEFAPAFNNLDLIFSTSDFDQNICDEIETWLSEDGELEVFCSIP